MPKSWDEWAAFVTVVGSALTALGYILNTFVKKPIDRIGIKVDKLDHQTEVRLDDHEKRLNKIEEWKELTEGAQHE